MRTRNCQQPTLMHMHGASTSTHGRKMTWCHRTAQHSREQRFTDSFYLPIATLSWQHDDMQAVQYSNSIACSAPITRALVAQRTKFCACSEGRRTCYHTQRPQAYTRPIHRSQSPPSTKRAWLPGGVTQRESQYTDCIYPTVFTSELCTATAE